MRGFAKAPRTQADKMRDVDLFLANARPEMVLAATGEELAARYGVSDRRVVSYKVAIAQQRLAGRA